MVACDMGMFGMSWMMWFPGLLIVAALLGVGTWAVARLSHRPGGALQILEDRLARGEIDAEEFQHRRSLLGEAR
jgi:uncharacterized membrane protein